MPSARAVIASSRRVVTGGAPRRVFHVVWLRAGEAGQPVGEQVERRRAPRLAGQPGVGDAAAEVRAQLVGGAADRAARVGGACGVVLGDRPALRLVGVEQRVAGPAAQHPGQLPAEVVGVADRGVHPGRAARREAVRGVADQERAALAEAVGERDAVVGGREVLDARLEVRDAGGDPDLAHQVCGRQVVEALVLGVPGPRVEPAVAVADRERGVVAGQEVDDVAVLADDVPQRRAEADGHAGREVARAAGRDPESTAHGAAHAVGGDQVAGEDRVHAVGVADLDLDLVVAAVGGDHLDAAAQAGRGQRGEVRLEDRLERVLGDARGAGRADDRALGAGRVADLDRRAGGGFRE